MSKQAVCVSAVCVLLVGFTHPSAASAPGCGTTVIESFVRAFNGSSAPSLAALFEGDADLLIPTGHLYAGRPIIEAFYHQVFDSGYRGSRVKARIVKTRLIDQTICLLDGTWELSAPGKDAAQAPEKGLFAAILRQKRGIWRIAALREQTGADTLELDTTLGATR